MANIINRSQYGNMSCMFACFKGGEITPKDLKYSNKYEINPVDICTGHLQFRPRMAEITKRTYYCPYLNQSTDERICEWVHSEYHDPQKSKPVGQTAIILEIMGLANNILNNSGRIKRIRWTKTAEKIFNYNWGDENLTSFIKGRILSYGPIIHLLNIIKQFPNEEFKTNDIHYYLEIKPSNEEVEINCKNGEVHQIDIWDGNTSSDAVVRSTASLLSLLAQTGYIIPTDDSISSELNPYTYASWLNKRAHNGKTSFPSKWKIQKENIESLNVSSLNKLHSFHSKSD